MVKRYVMLDNHTEIAGEQVVLASDYAALEARCRELEAALIYMLDFAMIGAVHREDDEKIEAACKLVGYQSETTGKS